MHNLLRMHPRIFNKPHMRFHATAHHAREKKSGNIGFLCVGIIGWMAKSIVAEMDAQFS